MRLFINGSNRLEITKGMREAIEDKLSMLNKFLKEDEKVQVAVKSVKNEIKVALMFYYNGKQIIIEHKGSDFYSVLDKVESSLKNQIERKHSLKIKQRKDQEYGFESFIATIDAQDINDEQEDNLPPIVKEKFIPPIPMTEKEAQRQMIENDYDTFIFINADRNNAYCSLYTRNDGSNGLMIISE